MEEKAGQPFAIDSAARAFAALGGEPRLAILRALVRAGPEGLATGALGAKVGLAPSTLSHHLRALTEAGLVVQRRAGRSLICTIDYARVRALASYLVAECCADAPAGHRHEEHAQ